MSKNENRPLNKGVFIQTYGCQMNVYDSDKIYDVLKPFGYEKVESPAQSDLVVLNTCHIREKATEKIYSEIGRLKMLKDEKQSQGKEMLIAVAGCVAQAEGEEILNRAKAVDIVVGPQAYHHLPEILAKRARDGGRTLDTSFEVVEKFDALPSPENIKGASAFVSVQEGCDKFCSFCVVPYTRGAEYSRPSAQILEEIKILEAKGAKEIFLLGQNVNAYEVDGISLADLIEKIARLSGIERIRYTTSHPNDMREDLIAAHGQIAKLMPYLHLPVQSGSNKILKAMNRKHTVETYSDIIERVRKARPDIAIASDFIVGFPSESEEDFADTLKLVQQINYASSFSFKYSPRPGTPASTLGRQIKEEIKEERLARLQDLLNAGQNAFNQSKNGQVLEILATNKGRRKGQILGKSPYLQSVYFEGGENLIGKIVKVKINFATTSALSGVLHEEFEIA